MKELFDFEYYALPAEIQRATRWIKGVNDEMSHPEIEAQCKRRLEESDVIAERDACVRVIDLIDLRRNARVIMTEEV